MIEAIENFFLNTLGRDWCVFLCSMIPIIECRGAVPLGVALGLPWWRVFLLAAVGNFLPVPFILLFIRKILSWMVNSRLKLFSSFGGWLEGKVEKHKSKIEKSYWGLVLFVGIPLPGTGGWTGSLIAAVLKMDFKKALLAIAVGVLLATTIMTLGSYGLVGIFNIFT